jgi:RHS repeat-associated protein
MAYDGLDRLTSASATIFGGNGVHEFAYDPLDNLRAWKLAGVKDFANYVYDANNRLAEIRNTAGSIVHTFGYDVQGNVVNKNSVGLDFDYGNRLREVTGQEYYRYDGMGRRVLAWRPSGGNTLSMYTQAGQVAYIHSEPLQKATENIYLGGSLVAIREVAFANNAVTTKYQHTDALGSPVAVSNEAGAVVERTNYDPYGGAIGKMVEGVGYTGHVMDPATGLTYMQQRYYDQSVGRFLSVDPIATNPNSGQGFNVYQYAANSPYRFVDPDGRVEKEKKDRRSICATKICDGVRSGGTTGRRTSGANSTSQRRDSASGGVQNVSTNGRSPATGDANPKPEGDFVLLNGVWIHRDSLNANVLGHADNQKSHVSGSTGAGATGFILFFGRSSSHSGAVDTSGATCVVAQECIMIGLGGFASGGQQLQGSVTHGPMMPGRSNTHGVFLVGGAGLGAAGGSIDGNESSVSVTGGGRTWGIGAAFGYQYCTTEVSSCR